MLHFECDYTRGAHPGIIERLNETNLVSTPGYGEDEYCEAAREKIRAAIGKEDAAVYFLVGGTSAAETARLPFRSRRPGIRSSRFPERTENSPPGLSEATSRAITPTRLGRISQDRVWFT